MHSQGITFKRIKNIFLFINFSAHYFNFKPNILGRIIMKENKIEEVIRRVDEKIKMKREEDRVNAMGIFKDGKTISNQEFVSTESNARLIEVSSSLMVPKIYIEILKKKLKKYKGFKLYLHYLLSKYDIHIANGIIPNYSNVTTKYQDKDQDLIKVGIRPWGSDWGELQLLRCSHGVSMSAIFVYLLKADSHDFAKTVLEFLVKAGIPSLPSLNFFGEIHLEHKKFFFRRVFRYQESIYN